ncbi:Uncharacterised protein [Yersinia bercovieri]|uniref:Uncharacterized protein n=1 Tax=Yersinia bercovieri ATCC 43970 TaxID=349968 RepID=A0ABM9Y043_YERBE|nr:hypothetical protein yberc0001_16530 [Yersinia bercovieri ATCC 43970]CNF51944.1 Uncharacterised protein [Yersinia bercovieri]CNH86990.1 Uncharacterised protein [Yersinia bercovieri]
MAVISLCKGRQFGINSLIFGAFFAGLILLFTFTAMPAKAIGSERRLIVHSQRVVGT